MQNLGFKWSIRMLFAAVLALALGAPAGVRAQNTNNNGKKPILTKSGKKAALQQATQDLLQISPLSASAPGGPTDATRVPHYFGPWPNWANTQFTLSNATVDITGDGTGATAIATVGANGAITGITVTNPGSGYTAATVSFGGAGAGASADAVVTGSGVVASIDVTAGGSGYTAPTVQITGGGATTPATAIAYGGVEDTITIDTPGSGYTFPTVDFDYPDGPEGVPAVGHAEFDPDTGAITAVVVDQPGSGYSFAPNVAIRNGTRYDPVPGGTGATASATIYIQTVALDNFGAGYTSAPAVSITDPVEPNLSSPSATAVATWDSGGVTAINLTAFGSGYLTPGVQKFVDELPVACDPSNGSQCEDLKTNLDQVIPLAVPDTTTFSSANPSAPAAPDADYYVIALVQNKEQMHSDLNPSIHREYVQLETPANIGWSRHVALQNYDVDGNPTPALMPDGSPALGVIEPHFLGPIISATKDRPVRIVFYNLLPKDSGGDLFIPVDSTIMGAGYTPDGYREVADLGTVMDEVRNPECTDNIIIDPVTGDPVVPLDKGENANCFKDNRATLHLHGGITPWISDGTPHQWITPAGENTSVPEGVSVGNVPDMAGVPGVPDCSAENDGCQTFYYTNQQSARFMFYHDHALGITRLNVYAGEAAGYLITDDMDQRLQDDGIIPTDQIPLVIQDRTFVPDDTQLMQQDPTWDYNAWGGEGNLWYHHVYMPAQNPGDPSGMSAFGRWMYGPWFWPPATPPHGPIANPYYDSMCDLNDPSTWPLHGYETDPFCEPALIPGTPNISAGMEQFNDTPIVNGTAYPTLTVEPKTYRLRILNAANDRFFNLSWYVGDITTASTALNNAGATIGATEVALNPAELAAAQIDPNVFPTPDTSVSPAGPDWIVIGSEGGFLPAPVVVPAQPTTWIIDPTVFNVGNVDKHSLLVGPAERSDVIVDFSAFAGQTLILYNDAPAAFPARVASYDYYTGAPDLSPVGAPTILPGYGPNTRTVMQVKVASTITPPNPADPPLPPASPFNLAALQNAFSHKADGSGVFESGQHPIIVGQMAYNSAYGTNFVGAGDCKRNPDPSGRCDGYLRIPDQGGTNFAFNTLRHPDLKLEIPIEPKAIHDEMNATAFDEFGRMQANMGLEVVPANPAAQNFVAYPYFNPPTELFDATNLPKNDLSMQPIGPIDTADGTQIWRITHNGVDTHPLHWHLYDLQLLNRVTWDNIVEPPDPTELGWKDTVRTSPLEDTIVAIRPIIPDLPFELPNSIRALSPWQPLGSPIGFNNVDAAGNPTSPILNSLVNFGWEYVWHCHILSHEEMDMMRPQAVSIPPNMPLGLNAAVTRLRGNNGDVTLTWNDNSLNETSFIVERQEGTNDWTVLTIIDSPLDQPNTTGPVSYVDTTYRANRSYLYRVSAANTVGYGGAFMSLTTLSTSSAVPVASAAPAAPSGLTAVFQAGPQVLLNWTDNSTNELNFVIQRSTDNFITFTEIATVGTNITSYLDILVTPGTTYEYRVFARNSAGDSAFSTPATVPVPLVPAAPSGLTAVFQAGPQVLLSWTDNSVGLTTGFVIQRSANGGIFADLTTVGANPTSYVDTAVIAGVTYSYQVIASNGAGLSGPSNIASAGVPTLPLAPTSLTAVLQTGLPLQIQLSWTDNSNNETGFLIQRSVNGGIFADLTTVAANVASFADTGIALGNTYSYMVFAFNGVGLSAPTNVASATVPLLLAPSGLDGSAVNIGARNARVTLTWTDNSTGETGFTVERALDAGFTSGLVSTNVPANSTTYTTGNVARGTTFYFRIQAFDATNTSFWSNTFSTTTP